MKTKPEAYDMTLGFSPTIPTDTLEEFAKKDCIKRLATKKKLTNPIVPLFKGLSKFLEWF